MKKHHDPDTMSLFFGTRYINHIDHANFRTDCSLFILQKSNFQAEITRLQHHVYTPAIRAIGP